jgi:hypothetical protein
LYLTSRIIKIGNGEDADFWRDSWCGGIPLKEKISDLFEISNGQNIFVAEMARRGWRLAFRRWLDEAAQIHLRQLRDILLTYALGP